MTSSDKFHQSHQYNIRLLKARENNKTFFPDKPINIDLAKSSVKEISYKTAEKVIIEYEWLKCMPSIVLFCYGIYFDGYLGGGSCLFPRIRRKFREMGWLRIHR